MNDLSPTPESWRRLYDLAGQIKQLAPWEWMTEEDLFGVADPDSDQLMFISIMGMLGEHTSVSAYLGENALYDFLDFHDDPPDEMSLASAARLLSMRQLQASFEDRDMLREQDRAVIKQLGLKFRGRGAWPLFRSYEAGLVPWMVTADEARRLALALEQVLEVAPRVREDAGLLNIERDEHFLVRVPRRDGERLIWSDEVRHVPPPEVQPVTVTIDKGLLEAFKKLPPRKLTVEVDLFMLLAAIGDRERPYYPYMLLLVNSQNGMILGQEMLVIETTYIALLADVPMLVVQRLAGVGLLPSAVHVSSPELYQVLQPVMQAAGIKLVPKHRLPELEAARESLAGFLGLGF